MKTYGAWMYRSAFFWGGGGFCTSWRWVVSFMPLPLYPRGKNPLYPLDGRLSAPQNRSGLRGEEKILDPTGTLNSDPLLVQLVASRYTDCAIPALRMNTVSKYAKLNVAHDWFCCSVLLQFRAIQLAAHGSYATSHLILCVPASVLFSFPQYVTTLLPLKKGRKFR
jgi:hypothetical protein